MEFAEILGKRIKELRKKSCLSQDQVAEGAGISSKYLGEIERGKVNVSCLILDKLAGVLGVDLTDFFRMQHHKPISEIKEEMKSFVDTDTEENVRILYSIFQALFR